MCAGRSQLQPGGQFVEAVLGEPFAITCRLCSTPTATATNAALRVDWQKEGVPVAESAEVRSFRRSRGEFVLRIRRMREDQLGNYTCILSEGGSIPRTRCRAQIRHLCRRGLSAMAADHLLQL